MLMDGTDSQRRTLRREIVLDMFNTIDHYICGVGFGDV